MAKRYQIYGFCSIDDEYGMNTLNGTQGEDWDEVGNEYNIVCFNGLAYFKSCAGFFKLTYPKLGHLSILDEEVIEMHCGFVPESGEYGPVCSALGRVEQITEDEFKQLLKDYPIKKEHYKYLPWMN